MAIYLTSLGDPETGGLLYRLTNELAYAMGRDFDLHAAPVMKADELILTAICIDPARAVVPASTSWRRSTKEFHSSFNVPFPDWSTTDSSGKVAALATAFVGAALEVPPTYLPTDARSALAAALHQAAERLSGEPDSLR